MPPETRVLPQTLAADLLRIKAVGFSPDAPFTWASGLKSPVYCDNRLTLAWPDVRARIAAGFGALIQAAGWQPEVIIGTATAGIPHAAWLADRLQLPMAYVRSKPKDHGRGNQIEGRVEAGQQGVIVEDLVSTGMSSLAVVQAVREAGVAVLGVVAIFSYDLPVARQAFAAAQVPLRPLLTFADLLSVAQAEALLSPDALASLQAWHADPQAWSDARISG
jgi:orotate phosphoribosyltransferase